MLVAGAAPNAGAAVVFRCHMLPWLGVGAGAGAGAGVKAGEGREAGAVAVAGVDVGAAVKVARLH